MGRSPVPAARHPRSAPQDHQIGLLQPGFQQTPDTEPRMTAVTRTYDSTGHQCVEQGRPVTPRNRWYSRPRADRE